MESEDLTHLRRHGFPDEAILEIVHIVGYFNYINRVADALGVDPEPEW
jgi:alkylhydroperoxidase family enzyme